MRRYVNHRFSMLNCYAVFVFWDCLTTLLLDVEQVVHLFEIGPLVGKVLNVVCQGDTTERRLFYIDEILRQFSLPLIQRYEAFVTTFLFFVFEIRLDVLI